MQWFKAYMRVVTFIQQLRLNVASIHISTSLESRDKEKRDARLEAGGIETTLGGDNYKTKRAINVSPYIIVIYDRP